VVPPTVGTGQHTRRRRHQGRPGRTRARPAISTQSGLNAPDALKMGCPFCGDARSAVVRSRGLITSDKIHRRRECAGCGGRFPTTERLDRELLTRELEARGALPPPDVFAGPPAPTWSNAQQLFARVLDEAKDGEFVASNWSALQTVIAGLQASGEGLPLHP
jgi:hypothetical protein